MNRGIAMLIIARNWLQIHRRLVFLACAVAAVTVLAVSWRERSVPRLAVYVSPPLGTRQRRVEVLVPRGWCVIERGKGVTGAWGRDILIRPIEPFPIFHGIVRHLLPRLRGEDGAIVISYREHSRLINLLGDGGVLMLPNFSPHMSASVDKLDTTGP